MEITFFPIQYIMLFWTKKKKIRRNDRNYKVFIQHATSAPAAFGGFWPWFLTWWFFFFFVLKNWWVFKRGGAKSIRTLGLSAGQTSDSSCINPVKN